MQPSFTSAWRLSELDSQKVKYSVREFRSHPSIILFITMAFALCMPFRSSLPLAFGSVFAYSMFFFVVVSSVAAVGLRLYRSSQPLAGLAAFCLIAIVSVLASMFVFHANNVLSIFP